MPATLYFSIGGIFHRRNFPGGTFLGGIFLGGIYRSRGNTYESHLNPLIILQKRAIRVITKSEYLTHTNNLFLRNRILKLPDIHKLKLGIYTFKNELFSQYTRSHSHNTRNRTQLLPEFHRLSSTQRSISYSAPSFWNEIPAYIRESPSLSSFKIRLKKCLIDKYNTDHL